MSEQGWQEFLRAEDVEDWVVLHGGPTACFATGGWEHGTRVATAVARALAAADDLGQAARVTLGATGVTVRLVRDVWQVEAPLASLARAVSRAAREEGGRAERSRVHEVQVAVAARPDELDVGFWRAVLGYDAAAEDNAVDPLGHGSTVWTQDLAPGRALRHAMHLDVSVAREQAEERLAAALAAGGRVVQDGEAPAAWILADRAGNRVCLASWPDGAVPRAPGAQAD